MILTFLGTGTSHGVPMIACSCPTCTSADPRDVRTNASVLISVGEKTSSLTAAGIFTSRPSNTGSTGWTMFF